MKKMLGWIMVLALICGCVPNAAAEEETPSIRVIHRPEGEEPVAVDLPLQTDMNGRWIWFQVPEDMPLDSLEVAYTPDAYGHLKIYFAYTILDSADGPIVLDFSKTQNEPYPYIIENPDTSEMVWFGWLTVSCADKPSDLPESPAFGEPAEEDPELPDPTQEPPEPTQEPTAMPTQEATAVPTQAPTAVPTQAPTAVPTQAPTAVPTEAPTAVPTEAPTAVPTQAPTAVPTQAPTAVPSQQPTASPTQPTFTATPLPAGTPVPPGPTPVPQTGYAIITGSTVNVRVAPLEQVIGVVQRGDVIYVTGQLRDQAGIMWHAVTVLGRGMNGFIRDDLLRFMTAQEIQEYLSRPAPTFLPTVAPPSPVPTMRSQIPTMPPVHPPASVSGYCRVVLQGTQMRNGPSNNANVIKALPLGTVVYVNGQLYDGINRRWVSVQIGFETGFLLAESVTQMTTDEVDAYLKTLKPTQAPSATPAATLDPSASYAVVVKDNVNFRRAPNGAVIRRLNRGTIARLVVNEPTIDGGQQWFHVRIDQDNGYLHADMIELVHMSPVSTPTPVPPVQTPPPTPTPAPVPPEQLPDTPSLPPMTPMERLRTWLDVRQLEEFAKKTAVHEADAYVIRSFGNDAANTLVIFNLKQSAEGHNGLEMTTYKLVNGQVTKIDGATKWYVPLLTPNTELQIVVVRQNSRDSIYIAQRNTKDGKTDFGIGLVLTPDETWERFSLTAMAEPPEPLLLVKADAAGMLTIDDRSGLRDLMGEPVDKDSLTLLMDVLYELVNESGL
ncbi:MAG: hypothetical protein FWG37_03320 [Clostridia bacterium]|nr:hypothetical protein [Clostridia bacterium]